MKSFFLAIIAIAVLFLGGCATSHEAVQLRVADEKLTAALEATSADVKAVQTAVGDVKRGVVTVTAPLEARLSTMEKRPIPAPVAPGISAHEVEAIAKRVIASSAPVASSAPASADTDLVDGLSAVAGHVSDHETRMNSIETRLGAIEAAKATPAPAPSPVVSSADLSAREKGLRRSFNGPMRNVTESLYWSLVRDGFDPQPSETDSDDFRKWLAEMSAKYAGSKSKKAKT